MTAAELPNGMATVTDTSSSVHENIFLYSVPLPDDAVHIRGYDFNQGLDWPTLMNQYMAVGFQGTNLGLAMEQINKMIEMREKTPGFKLYFGYTSNMISCGIREVIRFLVQNKMVDAIVSTAGGIEEDFIKCMGPTVLGDFHLDGATLRKKGLNRIGNMILPNNNYCKFEDFLMPILDSCLEEQQTKGTIWSPSKLIRLLGQKIDHPDSVYYWAYKNDIPVYCPALTDGSIGDMIYFHSIKNPGFILDIAQDVRYLNESAAKAAMTGMLILGGGTVKHHICNANLMRNGADYAVFINTGHEFDGSDSGASPDEAVSWGKIKMTARPVKINADASLLFPIIVAHTFAKHYWNKKTLSASTEPRQEETMH